MAIFVFGSNLAGIHGAGAAAYAQRHRGAQMGKGEGRSGNSYALPTKDRLIETLSLTEICEAVERFKAFARANPQLEFEVTPVGTGLAGYFVHDIEPFFADMPENCKRIDIDNLGNKVSHWIRR